MVMHAVLLVSGSVTGRGSVAGQRRLHIMQVLATSSLMHCSPLVCKAEQTVSIGAVAPEVNWTRKQQTGGCTESHRRSRYRTHWARRHCWSTSGGRSGAGRTSLMSSMRSGMLAYGR